MPGFGSLKPKPPAKTADGVETRYALVVGVDDYDDPAMPPLSFCSQDAAAIAEVLNARGYDVTLLHDGDGATTRPTLAAVERELRRIKRRADLDDLVVVYFSCHGKQLGGRPYLYLADTPNDDALVPSRGLAVGKVLTMLRGDARWIALFLDACHMGIGLDPGCHKSANRSVERAGGFALLSGSTTAGVTQDTFDGGVFSKVLRAGLAGGAADSDGCIRFSRLARYVQDGVEQWRSGEEAALMGSRQTPVLRLEVADLPLFPAHDYRDLSPQPTRTIRAAAFSRDGLLVLSCIDGAVQQWEPDTMSLLDRRWWTADLPGLACSPDGRFVTTVGSGGLVWVWQTASMVLSGRPDDLDTGLRAVAWSADSLRFAVARDGGVRMYVTDGAGEVTSNHDLGAFTTTVWDLAITPDDRLVTGDDAGEVRVMNLADGACERVWKYPGPAWEVAVSSDGHLVAAGGLEPAPTSKTPNDVLIWDRRDGALVARLVGHGGGVAAICWAPGDARLATASSDGQARIWDVRTATPDGAKVIRHLTVGVTGSGHGAQAQCAAFSPDGRYLFVGFDDGRGRLFKL